MIIPPPDQSPPGLIPKVPLEKVGCGIVGGWCPMRTGVGCVGAGWYPCQTRGTGRGIGCLDPRIVQSLLPQLKCKGQFVRGSFYSILKYWAYRPSQVPIALVHHGIQHVQQLKPLPASKAAKKQGTK
eukprot:1137889-Pelagomonas_calceolata.AAC.1